MAISSWMMRNRSIRVRRLSPDEYFRLDENKTAIENAYNIFMGLSNKKTSDSLRLCYLNEIVKLFDKHKPSTLGFSVDEFLYCFSVSVVHPQSQVRAAALKAIRHLLSLPRDLQKFNELQLPFLLCRCLDIILCNEEERMQALKLVRKMLAIAPDLISPVIVFCLVSLAEAGTEERFLRACLATLCEFGVLNPHLLIMSGGVSAITRNLLETHSPRIAESLCGVLLHLLEWPATRNIAGVRLECLAASYCDFTYRLNITDKNKDSEIRFHCSRIALLSVFKSFAGIIEFCNPNNPSGLKAIVDVLYLNQVEVRKAIIDLFYELIGLPTSTWTDDYSVALALVDPADLLDSWRVHEGFVASEGRSVLPALNHNVPNVTEIQLSLLLYCFVECSLLNALVQVIVTSDSFLSVRATILLGKLMQLMHSLLPADVCNTNHCLPTLIMRAAEGNHQAKAAVTALLNYHQMLRNRPASCSLFLDTIIQSGTLIDSRTFKREITTKEQCILPKKRLTLERRRYDSVGSSSANEGSDDTREGTGSSSSVRGINLRKIKLPFFDHFKEYEKLIRDSLVLTDAHTDWDWDIVITLLRSDLLTKMDEITTRFIRTLVAYYKPSSNKFSHQELSVNRQIPSFVVAGLDLLEWLLKSTELECIRLLTDLFTDIKSHLMAISTSRSAHDCLFSPQHMGTTMCQQYFLFIGRLCKNDQGLNVLTNTDVFKLLSNLILNTKHICYVKLIVSGLDYTYSVPRKILDKALKSSPQRASRHYATQFLLVLLRAKVPNFEVWGIPLIIEQLKDKERLISLTALDILLEACHDRMYLEEIVNIWPSAGLELLGDEGRLVITKFYSIPRGLNHSYANVQKEIETWVESFNKKYVLMLEADTHASLTQLTRNEDKTYSKRTCSNQPKIVPPNILPHLYGQLVQTSQGMANLQWHGEIGHLTETVQHARCQTEVQVLELKAALWALGHISTSAEGVEFLNDPISRIYKQITYLAKNAPVYSVRSTAINVLGLIGSTKQGADILYQFDWLCVRHDRNTFWPVMEPEDWFSKQLTPIRHHPDYVPPYNYTAMDDVNGTLSITGDGHTTFYFDDQTESSNEGTKESTTEQTDTPTSTQSKSKTLPDKIMSARTLKSKHIRSLSESKTVEGISVIQNPDVINRKRFNSGTDSNTSGVSSCDSMVAGRNIAEPITQHTLSPIPSSSNLIEMKRPRVRPRRISVTGVPLNDIGPSPQDIQGVNTFRSIRRNRPVLSESAVEEHNSTAVGVARSVGAKPLYGKSKSLDRHSSFSGYEEFKQNLMASQLLKSTNSKGPCYMGICLPKYINDLFPQKISSGTYVSHLYSTESVQTVGDMSAAAAANDALSDTGATMATSEQQTPILESMSDIGLISSMSDVSTASKKWRLTNKHDRNECLQCSRQRSNRTISNAHTFSKMAMAFNKLQFDYSHVSPETTFNFFDDSFMDRICGQILKQIIRMSNPVWSKQSKQVLLEFKNKHPQAFQNICLYSEVCKALGQCTYRPNTRRFIQEIFFDLDFDSFNIEPNEILSNKEQLGDETLEIIECDYATHGIRYSELRMSAMSSESSEVIQSQQQQQQPQEETVSGQSAFSPSNTFTATTGSSGSSGSSSSNSGNPVKIHLHFKSPALASVYEASSENLLSESVNSKKSSKLMLVPTTNNNNTLLVDTINVKASTISESGHVSDTASSISSTEHSSQTSTIVTNTANSNTNRVKPNYMRPRFNTLELDLSCTKNKFPIRDRSKLLTKDLGSDYTTSSGRLFTSNLSSSVATAALGSLYCEKRLKLSQSEDTLAAHQRNKDQ